MVIDSNFMYVAGNDMVRAFNIAPVSPTPDSPRGGKASGKLLWKVPFKTDYDQNSVTPVVYEDLLIFSGYGQPVAAATGLAA